MRFLQVLVEVDKAEFLYVASNFQWVEMLHSVSTELSPAKSTMALSSPPKQFGSYLIRKISTCLQKKRSTKAFEHSFQYWREVFLNDSQRVVDMFFSDL